MVPEYRTTVLIHFPVFRSDMDKAPINDNTPCLHLHGTTMFGVLTVCIGHFFTSSTSVLVVPPPSPPGSQW